MTDTSLQRGQGLFQKLRMAGSGAVHSMLFVLLGALISILGAQNLYVFFQKALTLLPLGSSQQTIEWITSSWPLAFVNFVAFVSSVSATLLGSAWFFGGLYHIFRNWISTPSAGILKDPELIAQELSAAFRGQTNLDKGPKGKSSFINLRFGYSPVSWILIKTGLFSALKIGFLWVAIISLAFGIEKSPAFLSKIFSVQFAIEIPSLGPIHGLFLVAIAFNLSLALVLIRKKRELVMSGSERVVISGTFAPSFYLSIFDNAFRLMSPKGQTPGQNRKLRNVRSPGLLASLVESHPRPVQSSAGSLGLVLALPAVAATVWGFSSLIGFSSVPVPSNTSELSLPLALGLLIDVFFFVGLVWLGLYIIDWVGVLVNVRQFESVIAICAVNRTAEDATDHSRVKPGRRGPNPWELDSDSNAELLSWAKAPEQSSSFHVEMAWSNIISESLEDSSPRYLFRGQNDPEYDGLVRKMFELTQNIRIEKAEGPMEVTAQVK